MTISDKVLRMLVRNHYDVHGDFNSLRQEPYYEQLKQLVRKENDTIREFPYSCIGISETKTLTAREVFEVKQMLSNENEKQLTSFQKRKKIQGDIIQFLFEEKITFTPPNSIVGNAEYNKVVDLLSLYLKEYDEPIVELQGKQYTLRDFCQGIVSANPSNPIKALKEYLFDLEFFKSIASVLNGIEINKDIRQDCIYRGVLYLTKEHDIEKLFKDAIISMFVPFGRINSSLYDQLITIQSKFGSVQYPRLGTITELQDFSKLMTELSLATGMPLRDFMNQNGFTYVDFMETYEEGVIILPCTNDYVYLIPHIAETNRDFVIISKEHYQYLYERNLLTSIEFGTGDFNLQGQVRSTDRMAFVNGNTKTPLYQMFLGNPEFNGNPNNLIPSNIIA